MVKAQIIREQTSPQTIANHIPGYSQITTINTVTISYTPPSPSTPITPVDGDTATEGNGVYEFGSILPVSISMADGNITTTSLGKVWTIRISVPNALNVGLVFTQFNLSQTAEMHIYNDDKTIINKGIKKASFTVSDTVPISAMKGNAVIVYVIEPNNYSTFQSVISIGEITAGYKEIDDVGDVGSSQFRASINCIPSVQCYPAHLASARAVARIEIPMGNRVGLCTGTLINNEQNNGRAFFLTAFHCIDNNNNNVIDPAEIAALRLARFQFQFWRTQCNSTINNTGIQFNGAILLSGFRNSDMVLLELINQPGIGDGVNYAGWSRQTATSSNTQSYIIHHPNGQDMRHTQTRNVNNFWANGDYWQANYSNGVVSPGSSGSALFNQFHQIIGQLKGGWSSCNYTDFSDRYGKFYRSWNGGNLQQWLSPTQGLQSIGPLILSPLQIEGDTHVPCNGQAQFNVPNLLTATYLWTVSNNLQIINGHGTSAITVTGTGSVGTVAVTINTTKGTLPAGRTLTISKQVTVASNIQATVNGPSSALANSQYYFSLSLNPWNTPVSNINWRVPSGWSILNGQGSAYTTIQTGTLTGAVEVDFDDDCGQPRGVYKTVVIGDGGEIPLSVCCGGGEEYARAAAGISTFPNPASNMITVSLTWTTTKLKNNFIRQIKITNKMGLVVRNTIFTDKAKSKQLNIALLKPDVYTIQVFNNKTWHSIKFIKK